MSVLISILIFLAVLFVLVLVHEWGHFIVAKKTGMRVDEFGIGFPPTVWGKQVGETKYVLNALPIGGYVKILGEDGEEGELSEADGSRTFGARPKWAQALVLIAGVAMNVLLAWVIFIIIALVGTTTAIEEGVRTDTSVLQVAGVLPDSPASVLPPGAVITAVSRESGESLDNLVPSAVTEFVRMSEAETLQVTYLYRDIETIVTLKPVAGLMSEDKERLALGVQLALTDTVRLGPVAAVIHATSQTISILIAIVVGVSTLLAGIFTGGADLSQVAGPVGIVSYVGEAASFGIVSLLFFTAVISLNLAIINLLPIPALDGGRLIFVAIEAINRRPISPVWAGRVNTIGFLFLIGLMVLVTVSDVGKLF